MQMTPDRQCEPAGSPSVGEITDHELLKRFSDRRDEGAFAALVARHGPLVLGVCRRVIGHHHDAEEVFQSTFLVLARKAAAGAAPVTLPNWLYRVAFRTAVKLRSAIARRRAKEVQATMIPEPQAPADDRWSEIAPLLDAELNRLPDKYQAAVICCDLKGLSRHDAARQLGWPEGTLKVRLMRGRSILAKRLARQGVVLSVGALTAVVSQNAASAAVPAGLATSTAKTAGAIVAAKAASAKLIGTKGALLTKGMAKTLFFGKAALVTAAAAGGVAVAAALFVVSKPKPAEQVRGRQLPPEVRQALVDNAMQLSPITVKWTALTERRPRPEGAAKQADAPQAPVSNRPLPEAAFRVVWQDQKMYRSSRFDYLVGAPGAGTRVSGTSECAFDGRVISNGHVPDPPTEGIAPGPGGGGVGGGGAGTKSPPKGQPPAGRMIQASLVKRPVASLLKSKNRGIDFNCGYFGAETGLIFAFDREGIVFGGKIVEQKLHADSAILDFLNKEGGNLIAVEDVPLDGKPCLRITLDGENPIQRAAEAFDLEQYRQAQKQFQDSRVNGMPPEQRQQLVRQYQDQIDRIEEQRRLPKTCRYTYYLDPRLHYAVRRFEQRYAPDTLLVRVDSSQFEQIPGRQLWLPRRVETHLHEQPTASKSATQDVVASRILDVSSFDGSRVPDETFTLNYTAAGTVVTDETDPSAAGGNGRLITYTLPARVEDLPRVIEQARQRALTAPFAGLMAPGAAAAPVASRRDGAIMAIVLTNMTMLVAGAAYVVWRRRSRDA